MVVYLNDVWNIIDSVELRPFTTGVLFLSLLAVIGSSISNYIGVSGIPGFWRTLGSTLFIGSGMGHWLGRAIKKNGDGVVSFLFGTFLTLSLYSVWLLRDSEFTVILVLSALTFFKFHNSNLIENSYTIRQLVNFFGSFATSGGLIIIAILQYLIPVATSLA